MTVYKMIEVIGTSNRSASHAITTAVKRASETLEDLGWFEVKEIRGRITNGKVEEFQVKLDIGFRLYRPEELAAKAAAAAAPKAAPPKPAAKAAKPAGKPAPARRK